MNDRQYAAYVVRKYVVFFSVDKTVRGLVRPQSFFELLKQY